MTLAVTFSLFKTSLQSTLVNDSSSLKSDSNWNKTLEAITTQQLTNNKLNKRILSRSRRTLLILRETNPERAGRIGDNCSYNSWTELVKVVYDQAVADGRFTDNGGIALAYKSMETFQKNFQFDSTSTPTDYRTWGAKYCIGKYPMECNDRSRTCKCLNLKDVPGNLYHFIPEVGSGRCNIDKNSSSVCDESINMYCEDRIPCVNGVCQEMHISYDGGQVVVRSKLGLIVCLIALFIVYFAVKL